MRELWAHQKEGIRRALQHKNFAFFFDPGLGKTFTVIEVLRYLFNTHKTVMPTLVLAPIITLENWKKEFILNSKIDPDRILPLHGPIKKRQKRMAAAIEKYGRGIIVITNYEAIVSSKNFFNDLLAWSPRVLIVDESQKVKTHNSKRTKNTVKLGDASEFTYLLTGTPVLNSPMDLYSQFLVMDGGETFGRNYYLFRQTYFYDKNFGMPKDKYFPDWVIRENSVEEINKLIYKKALRAKKAECLDLPPFIVKTISVELSPEQRRMYDEMKTSFITFLDTEAVTADMALTKALRLMQITTGFAKTDKDEIIRFDTPRKAALAEVLESITPGHKVIVWCVFKENYEQCIEVCTKLKVQYREAHGGISTKQKFKAVDDFNNDPLVRVFIAHPGALGIGINLIASSYSVYYSRNFSLEQDIQSEARNYRGGSEIHTTVNRINIVAKDTMDELVATALENKMKISEDVLREWKEKL